MDPRIHTVHLVKKTSLNPCSTCAIASPRTTPQIWEFGFNEQTEGQVSEVANPAGFVIDSV